MKNILLGTLGSEYYQKRYELNKNNINNSNETLQSKHAMLAGAFEGLLIGLISELKMHENKQS